MYYGTMHRTPLAVKALLAKRILTQDLAVSHASVH